MQIGLPARGIPKQRRMMPNTELEIAPMSRRRGVGGRRPRHLGHARACGSREPVLPAQRLTRTATDSSIAAPSPVGQGVGSWRLLAHACARTNTCTGSSSEAAVKDCGLRRRTIRSGCAVFHLVELGGEVGEGKEAVTDEDNERHTAGAEETGGGNPCGRRQRRQQL